jgi:hypothetical protein
MAFLLLTGDFDKKDEVLQKLANIKYSKNLDNLAITNPKSGIRMMKSLVGEGRMNLMLSHTHIETFAEDANPSIWSEEYNAELYKDLYGFLVLLIPSHEKIDSCEILETKLGNYLYGFSKSMIHNKIMIETDNKTVDEIVKEIESWTKVLIRGIEFSPQDIHCKRVSVSRLLGATSTNSNSI